MKGLPDEARVRPRVEAQSGLPDEACVRPRETA
jgi:hypothetical protein